MITTQKVVGQQEQDATKYGSMTTVIILVIVALMVDAVPSCHVSCSLAERFMLKQLNIVHQGMVNARIP